jgi:hypothetical protein
MPKLNNWGLVRIPSDNLPKEFWEVRAFGETEGHPTISDGTTITTSPIIKVNLARKQIQTVNTLYDLGTKDEFYEKSV